MGGVKISDNFFEALGVRIKRGYGRMATDRRTTCILVKRHLINRHARVLPKRIKNVRIMTVNKRLTET
jgi:hypothetical protein